MGEKCRKNRKILYISMPLVIMCGYPCSGKSKRAKELKNYLENSRGKTVHLASDESLNLERNTVYAGRFTRAVLLHIFAYPA